MHGSCSAVLRGCPYGRGDVQTWRCRVVGWANEAWGKAVWAAGCSSLLICVLNYQSHMCRASLDSPLPHPLCLP